MSASNEGPALRGRELWALLAVLAACAVLFAYELGRDGLLGDEFTVAYIAPESIPDILRLTFVDIIDPAYGRNRPLFNLLAHASLRVFERFTDQCGGSFTKNTAVARLIKWPRHCGWVFTILCQGFLHRGVQRP